MMIRRREQLCSIHESMFQSSVCGASGDGGGACDSFSPVRFTDETTRPMIIDGLRFSGGW